jgi:hypothetical protein
MSATKPSGVRTEADREAKGGATLETRKPSLLERVAYAADKNPGPGQTIQELLRQELSQPVPAPEPTPACLTDIETLNFCEDNDLDAGRLAHVESCLWCQSMLAGLVHTGDGFWQEFRRRQSEATRRQESAVSSAG